MVKKKIEFTDIIYKDDKIETNLYNLTTVTRGWIACNTNSHTKIFTHTYKYLHTHTKCWKNVIHEIYLLTYKSSGLTIFQYFIVLNKTRTTLSVKAKLNISDSWTNEQYKHKVKTQILLTKIDKKLHKNQKASYGLTCFDCSKYNVLLS